jgi:hypothetical protein
MGGIGTVDSSQDRARIDQGRHCRTR